MKYRHIPSIRGRMTLAFALAILLFTAISSSILKEQVRQSTEKRAREILLAAMLRIKSELKQPHNRDRSLLDLAKAEQGELTVGNLALMVFNSDGEMLWKSREEIPHWPLTEEEKIEWRVQTIESRGQTLVLARPWGALTGILKEREKLSTFFAVILVLASAGGAWFVVGRTLSPIDQLSQQAQRASVKGLRVRLVAPSRDAEIVGLVGTLNGLIERLAKEASSRGRFYAAASHELRTPLQALVGELDVILSRPRSNEEYHQALEAVQEQSLRLMALVQDLLRMNQIEMTSGTSMTNRIELDDLMRRTQHIFEAEIQRRNLNVESDLADCIVMAPVHHIEMLLRNLMENAVKYTDESRQIRIHLRNDERAVHLKIWNSAHIEPETDLSLWLEPFYRPLTMESHKSEGNGLGLAICQSICEQNGWNIQLSNQEGGLLVEVVWLT